MRISRTFLIGLSLLIATTASAEVRTRVVDYRQGDTELQGYLAWDDAAKSPRPGVIVVHEWWGHNAHARRAAERLARAGYVAFALDMFGKGKLATHPDEAQAFVAEATRDDVAPERFQAALDVLEADAHVDTSRIGAIGYCFGGAVALDMARQGAGLKAVGTFHAALATRTPAEPGKVKAKLLVQTGGADPLVPPDAVAAFEKEMKDAGADVRIIRYPGARHSFTNPDADKAGLEMLHYDAKAADKSWKELIRFFKRNL